MSFGKNEVKVANGTTNGSSDLMDIDDDGPENLVKEIEARSAPPKVYRKGYQVKNMQIIVSECRLKFNN